MVGMKNLCASLVLAVAVVGHGAQSHACSLDGQSGMHRYSPFHAGSYGSGHSRSAFPKSEKIVVPSPNSNDASNRPYDELSLDRRVAGNQNLTSTENETGRSKHENRIAPRNGQGEYPPEPVSNAAKFH